MARQACEASGGQAPILASLPIFIPSYFPPALRHSTATLKLSCATATARPVWSQKPSEAASRRQGGHARTRTYRPLEDRPRQDRTVPLYHLSQNYRGYVRRSAPTGLAGMNLTSTKDRRSRLMVSETRIR